jgi:hypothetical protein
MTRSLRTALLVLSSCALIAAVPLACRSGGVGDPCTPEAEAHPDFGGFALTQEYIESRSFQCSTRVCLVNHFQGRVSCPLGQAASTIRDCGGPDGAHEELCDASRGEKCVASRRLAPACDPQEPRACDGIGSCDPDQRICVCDPNTVPPDGYHCTPEGSVSVLTSFVCHVPGACQTADGTAEGNAGKDCCVPSSDTPVGVPVCGQCARSSGRDAREAVYCSCRCGVADGVDFCTCPSGFTCSEIRPLIGIEGAGDRELTGKYCIKQGSAYGGSEVACGVVEGNHEEPCAGIGGS